MAGNDTHFSGEGHLIEAVILGDPNKTVIPVVCDSSGRLIVDLTGTTITIGAVDIFDSVGNPIISTAGSINANVTNLPAIQDVSIDQTGTNNVVRELNVDKNFGTWSYYAGTSGTVVVTAGQRVIGIGTHSTGSGTLTINGGPSVPIPAGISINIEPLGNVVAPTLVFTGTDSYFIEVVS